MKEGKQSGDLAISGGALPCPQRSRTVCHEKKKKKKEE